MAEKRLVIIAAYVQAVLEESRLRENMDVRAFLDQGRGQAQACGAKALHDAVTWTSAMNPKGHEHVAATAADTPVASTCSSIAIYSPTCPEPFRPCACTHDGDGGDECNPTPPAVPLYGTAATVLYQATTTATR